MKRIIYLLFVLALSLSAHAAGTLAEVTPEEIYLTANVGDTVTATITITNISTQSISPSASLTSDDGYFWIDDINDDIPPAPGNNVREIIVTYSPDQAGYHYAYLSLYINDEFYYVEIAGEAIGPQTPKPTITITSVSDYNDPKYMITIENDDDDTADTIEEIKSGDVVVIEVDKDGNVASLTVKALNGRFGNRDRNRNNNNNNNGNGNRKNRDNGKRRSGNGDPEDA